MRTKSLGDKTIAQCVDALMLHRSELLARQTKIELAEIRRNGKIHDSRNGHPCTGWCVPGNSAWTQAVKASNMPWDCYWSGSNPTPSTQYPIAVAEFLESFCFGESQTDYKDYAKKLLSES